MSLISKFDEEYWIQGFCKAISDLLRSDHILHGYITRLNSFPYKMMSEVNVFRVTMISRIIRKTNTSIVILSKHNWCSDVETHLLQQNASCVAVAADIYSASIVLSATVA